MRTPSASANSETPQTVPPSGAGRKQSRLPAITFAVAGVFLTAVAVYGSVRGHARAGDRIVTPVAAPRSTGDPATQDGAPSSPETDGLDAGPTTRMVPPRTTDPIAYAAGVARVLFGWDTAIGPGRADRIRALMREAAPSGADSEALASDLANYLPSAQAWRHLADYETRQSLSIDHAVVPEAWWEAKATAGDDVAAGAVAVTVDGIRHRAGAWHGETVTTDHEVTFTVFVTCPPTSRRCRLLRLSAPNTPLR